MKSQCCISILLLMSITRLHCIQLGEGTKIETVSRKLEGTMKTIKTEDGDVVDCVDIYKQPSLNHPLFKNHVIQMSPSSYLRRIVQKNDSSTMAYQNWSKYEKCPKGTIPIRRSSTVNDQTSTNFREIFPSEHISGSNDYGLQYAILGVQQPFPDLYGTAAAINVWEPWTENSDSSVSQISLIFARGETSIEAVKAGWMVNPAKFGDGHARLFVMYGNDTFRTVCFNFDCPGFVQTDPSIVLGSKIEPISTYSGAQYKIDVGLFLDSRTQKVWFRFGTKWIGYWPHTILPYLSVAANTMTWGGYVFQGSRTTVPTATQMGSGHFPGEGAGKASYMSHVKYLNSNAVWNDPPPNAIGFYLTKPECYGISTPMNDTIRGFMFYFGGPGRSASCDH